MIRTATFARTALSIVAAAAITLSASPLRAASADGQDRRVAIENRSGQAIVYVYGSPVSQADFGADRIPDRIIGHGDGAVVDFDSGTAECIYDLRVTMEDGTDIDRMGVNVCQRVQWTVEPRTNTLQ